MARFLSNFHLSKDGLDDRFTSCIVDAAGLGSKKPCHALSWSCVFWDSPLWSITDLFVVLDTSSCDERIDV